VFLHVRRPSTPMLGLAARRAETTPLLDGV
jgi:hypothetical protein